MTIHLPDREKQTCLFFACHLGSDMDIYLHKLGKNARPLVKSLQISLSDNALSSKTASRLLTYLGGSQIIHYADARSLEMLNDAIVQAGCAPIPNEIYDVAPLAKAFCRVKGLPEEPTLDDFAELGGATSNERLKARICPRTGAMLLRNVWVDFIYGPLGYTTSLDVHIVSPPRDITSIDMSLHGLPLPAPIIPDVPKPASGWRQTPWGAEEARDCALRFVEGGSLEELSTLLRRSPRAIRARLILDGILQPD